MDIINKLEITKELIVKTADDGYIVLIKPTKVDELPVINPLLINNKYLTINTSESILKYFNDLINNSDDMRITVLNGIKLEFEYNSYYCDYCKTSINDDWFYCYHCYNDMCKMCNEEKSEEIALKNGSINYKNREKKLNECFVCNKIVSRNIYYLNSSCNYYCDLCNNDIIDTHYYSTKNKNYNSYDICLPCVELNPKAKEEVETKSMKLIDKNDKNNINFNHTDFNSMLDWFPIVSDTGYCSILMNLNIHDKNYKKLCLQSCDNHGRMGYYIIQNEKYDLNEVLKRLKEICDAGVYEYIDFEKIEGEYKEVVKTKKLCSYYDSSPIQILMTELKMQVYYG